MIPQHRQLTNRIFLQCFDSSQNHEEFERAARYVQEHDELILKEANERIKKLEDALNALRSSPGWFADDTIKYINAALKCTEGTGI